MSNFVGQGCSVIDFLPGWRRRGGEEGDEASFALLADGRSKRELTIDMHNALHFVHRPIKLCGQLFTIGLGADLPGIAARSFKSSAQLLQLFYRKSDNT